MNDFEQQIPIIGGWVSLDFRSDKLTKHIPSDEMLEDLIHPPQPHTVSVLLLKYQLPEKTEQKIIEIITSTNSIPSWLEIREVLDEDRIYQDHQFGRLYAVIDRNCRGLPQKGSIQSQQILQSSSDGVVNLLNNRIDNPSESETKKRGQLKRSGINYEEYLYHDSVLKYCEMMLPYPIRTMPNERADKKFVEQLGGDLSDRLKASNDLLRRYPEEMKRAISLSNEDAWTYEFFLAFRHSFSYRRALNIHLKSIGLTPKTNSHSVSRNKLLDMFERDKKLSKGKTREELPQLLCRCQFCFSFRLERPANGKIARHCGGKNSPCGMAEKVWRDRLKNKGIMIGSLSV